MRLLVGAPLLRGPCWISLFLLGLHSALLASAFELDPRSTQNLTHWLEVFEAPSPLEASAADPCWTPALRDCRAVFHSHRAPVTISCSSASGDLYPQLPLHFPGNYDLCVSIQDLAQAHFCTVDVPNVPLPLQESLGHFSGDFVMLGRVHVGKCVPKTCTSSMILRSFTRVVHEKITSVRRAHPLAVQLGFVEALIRQHAVVRCEDEELKELGSVWGDGGAMSMIVLMVVCVALVVSCTIAERAGVRSRLSEPFNAERATSALLAPFRGDFVVLNGVRVISMLWIIFGHVVLYSSGVVMHTPVSNPTSVDEMNASIWMVIARGGEFSVDTFFFMSGFLGMWGGLQVITSDMSLMQLLRAMLKLILARFLRLAPVYIFVMGAYVFVLPRVGGGPYWHANLGRDVLQNQCTYWWTNLLFINNIYPWSESSHVGIMGCMPWSWYLANDQQFFLLVVPLAYWLKRSRASSHLVAMLPFISLILFQIGITWWTMVKYDIDGANSSAFHQHVYVTPWCRVSSFAVGMALAGLHTRHRDSLADPNDWKAQPYFGLSARFNGVVFLTCFVGGLAVVFSAYDWYHCKAERPEDCRVWGAYLVYGALGSSNWSKLSIRFYYSLTYAAWSIGIGGLAVFAFSRQTSADATDLASLLSRPVFAPLARLTYIVYLIHIPIIQTLCASAPGSRYYTLGKVLSDTLFVTVLAYAGAFLLYVALERPATRLLRFGSAGERETRTSSQDRASSASTNVVSLQESSSSDSGRVPLLSSSNAPV